MEGDAHPTTGKRQFSALMLRDSLRTVQMVLSPHFEWRSHHKVAARVLSIGVNNNPGEWNNVVGEFL
jgi:hypothetical protein